MRHNDEFAASLLQQTKRARNPISIEAYCARYCPDATRKVAPRYVADEFGFTQKRSTYEEKLAVLAMLTDETARESRFTFCYFLGARGLAEYAFTLKEERLDTLGRYWAINEGKRFKRFAERHNVPEEDQAKLLSLWETVDELFTVYVDKSYLPSLVA